MSRTHPIDPSLPPDPAADIPDPAEEALHMEPEDDLQKPRIGPDASTPTEGPSIHKPGE